MQNIIYQIDSDGNRKGNVNYTGEFHPDSTKDNCWLYIRDDEGKGEYIYYSDYDMPDADGAYIIVECNGGIFRVQKI